MMLVNLMPRDTIIARRVHPGWYEFVLEGNREYVHVVCPGRPFLAIEVASDGQLYIPASEYRAMALTAPSPRVSATHASD